MQVRTPQKFPEAPEHLRRKLMESGAWVQPGAMPEMPTEKLYRIHPPMSLGPPKDVEEILTTATDKKNRLEGDHYRQGGVYVDAHEINQYFNQATPDTMVAMTVMNNQITSVQEVPINFEELSDDEYEDMKDRVSTWLYENNYATKGILKTLTLEEMHERYKGIPKELFQ